MVKREDGWGSSVRKFFQLNGLVANRVHSQECVCNCPASLLLLTSAYSVHERTRRVFFAPSLICIREAENVWISWQSLSKLQTFYVPRQKTKWFCGTLLLNSTLSVVILLTSKFHLRNPSQIFDWVDSWVWGILLKFNGGKKSSAECTDRIRFTDCYWYNLDFTLEPGFFSKTASVFLWRFGLVEVWFWQ